MECQFSDAGCDARVCRKDLPSHLAENMVAHMSLLAQENRKFKLQLKEQDKKVIESDNERRELKLQLKELELRLKKQEETIEHAKINPRLPPLEFRFDFYQNISFEFYSHLGGYKA